MLGGGAGSPKAGWSLPSQRGCSSIPEYPEVSPAMGQTWGVQPCWDRCCPVGWGAAAGGCPRGGYQQDGVMLGSA